MTKITQTLSSVRLEYCNLYFDIKSLARGSLFKRAAHMTPLPLTAPIPVNQGTRKGTEKVLQLWNNPSWGRRHKNLDFGAVPQPPEKWWLS